MPRPLKAEQRISEGWQFTEKPRGMDSIARIAEHNIYEGSVAQCKFKTDEEAVAFVTARAAEGSEYHIECLKYAAIQRMKA